VTRASDDAERVLLGRVVGAHALRGEVRVRFFGDGPGQLLNAECVYLGNDEARGDLAKPHAVERTGTGRAGEVRLALEGVEDRNAAESLKGQAVFGLLAELPELGDDEFYWHELVGFDVVSEEGEPIGRVRELWETGAHDVLVVDDAEGRQILLPTAREIMTGVDRAARRIEIRVLPGLLDQEA
jgi:16S rRNA processing protein RimM